MGGARFLKEVARVEQFLNGPWLIKSRENAMILVKDPKVVVSLTPSPPPVQFLGVGGEVDEAALGAWAQVKKQAAAASIVAEDYAGRFESGDFKPCSLLSPCRPSLRLATAHPSSLKATASSHHHLGSGHCTSFFATIHCLR